MLKFHGIVIYLLFTTTVAQDATIPKSENSDQENKIDISLAKAEFEYDVKGIQGLTDLKLINEDGENTENEQITTIKHIPSQSKHNKKKHRKFFDFITDGIKILQKYSDTDLKQFFLIFTDEIKKFHYRGCKFYELIENFNFRMLISKYLLLIKEKPADLLRRYLKAIHDVIEEAKFNINKRILIDLINGLYSHHTVTKFDKILNNLEHYGIRATDDMDLVKIIRSGLRSTLFDYYTDSSDHTKAKIKETINEYLEYLSIVKSYNKETNNTNTNDDKNGQIKSKIHTKNKTFRIDNEKDDNTSVLPKKIHQIEPQTKTAKKILKPSDMIYVFKTNKMLEPRIVEVTTKKKDKHVRERKTKHRYKQMERKGQQEHKVDEHIPTASYGFWNGPETDNLELLQDTTELPSRQTHGQVFRYEMHLNPERKNIEPKLYLKTPEFQVKLPALQFQNNLVHINRPSGQSFVDAPTFNHKNSINVRRMFDTGHLVKQANRGIDLVPIHPVNRYKEPSNIQGRRQFPQIITDAAGIAPTGPDFDPEINEYDNRIDNINIQSQVLAATDLKDMKHGNKELPVDLKLSFDTFKRIISHPIDAIREAIYGKPKKKVKSLFNNEPIRMRSSNLSDSNNNTTKFTSKAATESKTKHTSTKKGTTRVTKQKSVDKTSTVKTDDKEQHNDNTPEDVTQTSTTKQTTKETGKAETAQGTTKTDISNVTKENIEDKKPSPLNGQHTKTFRVNEVSRTVKNKKVITVPETTETTQRTYSYEIIRFTNGVDRFRYLRELMHNYNNRISLY